jgi:hypothetical protein
MPAFVKQSFFSIGFLIYLDHITSFLKRDSSQILLLLDYVIINYLRDLIGFVLRKFQRDYVIEQHVNEHSKEKCHRQYNFNLSRALT